jgi:hypothetical protein
MRGSEPEGQPHKEQQAPSAQEAQKQETQKAEKVATYSDQQSTLSLLILYLSLSFHASYNAT